MAIRFFGALGFSAETEQKYVKWYGEQCLKAVEKQKAEIDPKDPFIDFFRQSWGLGYPYTGAIGGDVTFEYTPNGIGESLWVKHNVTGDKIDLSEYDRW